MTPPTYKEHFESIDLSKLLDGQAVLNQTTSTSHTLSAICPHALFSALPDLSSFEVVRRETKIIKWSFIANLKSPDLAKGDNISLGLSHMFL